ncbi:MAG TPA: metalloregulator ArsR/SmtB family transcription factor [Pseudonocardiaceae bacterium]|nr:metalloregulator ArsR/SmtB family transcription factor [Pseudonocardiaceae bacterium]
MPADTDVYTAIADPTRRRILDLLTDADRSAGELAEPFRMSRPAISQHLRVLREAGLVSERKAGRRRIYRLAAGGLRDAHSWLGGYQRFWQVRFAALGDYLDAAADGENR